MGADLCWTLGDDGLGEWVPQWWSEGITPENFENFICQTMHFGEYLWDNWSTEWVHFTVLKTDVEAFLNQLFLQDNSITVGRRCWHNRKLIHAKLALILQYWKFSQIIISMTKYWKEHYLSCSRKQYYYWGHVPQVSAPCKWSN